MTDYVVIGDGIAGATATEFLYENDDTADISVITNESEPLYNRINIKEHAKGRMPEKHIRMHTEEWYEERNIELMLNTLVNEIDNDRNTAILHNGDEIDYDKLLIAAGGSPRNLDVPHGDADRIHNFWTFVDSRKIKRDAENVDHGVIIGAGLLGIDFAYALAKNDVKGKYLMRGDRWWRYALDMEGSEIIHKELRSEGIEPVFGEGVDRFEINKMGEVVRCQGTTGETYPCEIAGICIGLDLNTDILDGTGVETDYGIYVDEFMQTSDPDIFAAGDITEFHDVILEERNINGSWDSAKKQGKIAAENMMEPEEQVEFRLVPKYSVSHFSTPFISLGDPTKGEEYYSRQYGEKDYRRIAVKNDRVVGGVLIGNVRVVGQLTKIIESKEKIDEPEKLLEEEIPVEPDRKKAK